MATKKPETEVAEAKANANDEEERVMVFLQYVEGEPKEETVGVNGVLYQVAKGKEVSVPKSVAGVLSRSNLQMMVAYDNQQQMKNQHQDW